MISLIIPTYNESENILTLVNGVKESFAKNSITDFEIRVMDDDSPDGTAEKVKALNDPRVKVINRRGRPRGLAAAVIDGFKEASGDVLGVMDADLSHPPETLPRLVRAISEGNQIAVGSRYVPGGGIEDWPLKRVVVSRVACWMARPFTGVKDATSGFFLVRASALDGVRFNPLGFKIGLEVFVRSRHGGKIKEVPYVFTDRKKGFSKFNGPIIGCYLKQLFSLWHER